MAVGAHQEIPTRSQERSGTYNDLSDEALWDALVKSRRVAVVGLKAPGQNRGFWRGKILLSRSQWIEARSAVTSQLGVTFIEADTLLPTVQIELDDIEALRAVRKLPVVDYVQPRYVDSGMKSLWASGDGSTGCGYSSWSDGVVYTADGDAYSHSMQRMQVHHAWNRSNGSGVWMGLTDTGVSLYNEDLASASAFTSGRSGGRSILHLHTVDVVSPWDQCGHGTKMAGLMAAPWNGRNVVGVAWGANLASVRQADQVPTVDSEAAKRSIRMAAENIYYQPGGKIITMAWQSLNWLYQVSDEIQWWYYNYPIFFIAAAGTSGCNDSVLDGNVVFPADQSEVFAVTGVDGNGNVPCGVHYGSPVQLVAYIPQTATGEFTSEVARLSGSSSATALVSGVAALTWSKYPWLSRDQLRDQLRYAGSYYPNKDGDRGWGIVNAMKAVGGIWRMAIEGCSGNNCEFRYSLTQCEMRTFTVSHEGGDGPYTYRWSTGNTMQTAEMELCPVAYEEAQYSLWAAVKDNSDGTELFQSVKIMVTDPNHPCPTCPL